MGETLALNPRRAPRGLTLVEILVILAIVAIAMAMVLTCFGYAIRTVRSFQGG